MSQLVKTKRQANFKDFKRFGVFKGLVEQKNVVFNSLVCKMGFFGTRGPLKRSFHSPNLHKNLSNKLLLPLMNVAKKRVLKNVCFVA
jgi:hypothetical protein